MSAQVHAAPASSDERRYADAHDVDSDEHDIDADHEVDDGAGGKPKKKRRVIKTSDKKYDCPHSDCGKSYSRAEHLYRHQLNRELYRPHPTHIIS